MVMKPRSFTYSCPVCGWKMTVAPVSDVRFERQDSFSLCLSCGNQNLAVKPASPIDGLAAQVERTLRRLM